MPAAIIRLACSLLCDAPEFLRPALRFLAFLRRLLKLEDDPQDCLSRPKRFLELLELWLGLPVLTLLQGHGPLNGRRSKNRLDRVCGITVCVCGLFRGAIFQPGISTCDCAPPARPSGWGVTAHGLRHSAATILLNHVGKDLRKIQELLRHKNIRTTRPLHPRRL